MSTNNNTFTMQCRSQQRQRQTILGAQNNVSSRFEMKCPSLGFTTEQLDMRRKAEILQYLQNATSQSTVVKRWAWLVKHNKRTVYCEDISTKPTPSSSSDVPGPVILLYKDRAVPLTMYRNDQYIRFTDIPYTNYNFEWEISQINDVIEPNNASAKIGHLSMIQPNSTSMVFQTTIPVSLSIQTNFTPTIISTNVATIDMVVTRATLHLYFNDKPVSTVSPNVSFLDRLTISISDSQDGPISATKYIGSLYVPGISLSTYPSNVFAIRLVMNIQMTMYDASGNVVQGSSANLYNTQINFIGNIKDAFTSNGATTPEFYSYLNCIVEYPPNVSTFQAFSWENANVIAA
jgi:hypothetical protein